MSLPTSLSTHLSPHPVHVLLTPLSIGYVERNEDRTVNGSWKLRLWLHIIYIACNHAWLFILNINICHGVCVFVCMCVCISQDFFKYSSYYYKFPFTHICKFFEEPVSTDKMLNGRGNLKSISSQRCNENINF